MKIDKQISSWVKAIYLAIEENPEKTKEILSNLKKQLGKDKAKYYPIILKKFCQFYEKEKRAELILSIDFSEEEKEKIKKALRQKIKGLGDMVETVDSDLIAGFRLKTKDVLVKASLKDVLTGIKNKTYGYN
jgi:F0F1-type ATP synthase delta subunit